MSTVYQINKGINRSIEFKGIKAQYIIYLAAGMVGLLLILCILYAIGINMYVCLGIILPTGTALYLAVQRFSKKYGEHGLLKHAAGKQIPASIKTTSRKVFTQLSKKKDEKQ